MKRDNLKSYREEKVKRNTELLKRSIEHIKKYSGNISMSTVSKVTYDIAKEDEKGLSVPAISKNELYRALVQEAQNNTAHKNRSIQENELSSKALKDMSQAELIAEIYKLRVSTLQTQKELAVLKDIVAEYKINTSVDNKDTKSDTECIFALQHTLQVLLGQNILYIEKETFDVKLAAFGTLVLKGSIYKKFFNNKVDINGNYQGDNK